MGDPSLEAGVVIARGRLCRRLRCGLGDLERQSGLLTSTLRTFRVLLPALSTLASTGPGKDPPLQQMHYSVAYQA